MALLKRRDLLADAGMGGAARAATHERDRYNARQSVFPIGSPVAHGQRKKPKLLSRKRADGNDKTLKARLKPLLEAREDANKVMTDTRSYFENHYPVADKDLKTALNERVMNAHSRLRAKGKEGHKEKEEEEHEAPTIQIILNIGGK